ncbi:MAG: GAF domain-containing protein [Sphaerospermopsis sp. SIO1G2]|nr:GAF domain-containing protein [Sphaerospermopsis sp. SIO1G2]
MSEAVNALFAETGSAHAIVLDAQEKTARYEEIAPFIRGILADDTASALALMSSVLSVLHNSFDSFFWTGFYRRIDTDTLEVGPNQGTMGCTHIKFGKGVCGTVATTEKTKIVADVHAEPNHIGCDSLSQSEIVVPLFVSGKLAAVLDVDSTQLGAFCDVDRRYLEQLMAMLGEALERLDLSGVIAF